MFTRIGASLLGGALLWAAASDAVRAADPGFIEPGTVQVTVFDGVSDDLLTAGLGAAGLAGTTVPAYADPLNPTVAELRRNTIFNNYRGIVDIAPGGGYGVLYGPDFAPSFPGVPAGHIPGVQYMAYSSLPQGDNRVFLTLMAMIPKNFDVSKPCILVTAPSGSRGIYGAAGVAEWGLIKGCAVAVSDKLSGTGFHLLGSNIAYDINGVAEDADFLRKAAQYRAVNEQKVADFLADHPERVASKHAHSLLNPERSWGRFVVRSIRFTLWALNQQFAGSGAPKFDSDNTLIIAAGVSNGAGSIVRAVEADSAGFIDGAVVTEPNVQPDSAGKFDIQVGNTTFSNHGKGLYEAITVMGTYAPCAALLNSLAGTPFFGVEALTTPAITEPTRENRCTSLFEAGLLTATTTQGRAAEAMNIIRDIGYTPQAETVLAAHEWLNLWRSLQPTYAAAHGRFAVWENICNVSFAATNAADGSVVPVPATAAAQLFANSSGIPPTGGINTIADDSLGGPILENLAVSASTGRQDLNFEAARCFRYLATGDPADLGRTPRYSDIRNYQRVRDGIRQVKMNGDLHGVPTIIIHGRNDGLVFVNQNSRPYFGLNQLVEGSHSHLSYIEVTSAQHFDTFNSSLFRNPVTGEVMFVPLHHYLFEALDKMYAHLLNPTNGLPASQVVRPTPRGLVDYTSANEAALLPPIVQIPAARDAITFSGTTLTIPE